MRVSKLVLCGAAALGLAFPAVAQWSDPYGQDFSREHRSTSDFGYGSTDAVTGRVVEFSHLNVADGAPTALKLRVRTEEGQTRSVMLTDELGMQRGMTLNAGDRCQLRGNMVTVNGQNLFDVADICRGSECQQQANQLGQRIISGTLEEINHVAVKKGEIRAVVATLDSNRGPVDVLFGARHDLRRSGDILARGSTIDATGDFSRFDGTTAFVANDIAVLSPAGQMRMTGMRETGQSFRSAQARERFGTKCRASGEVLRVREVNYDRLATPHLIAVVETQMGNIVPVDLGPANSSPASRIEEGDWLTAHGKVGEISGQPALIATDLEQDNRNFRIRQARFLSRETMDQQQW